MKKHLLAIVLFALILMIPVHYTYAQLGGEELPPGVAGEDVYRVSRQMYCEVCQGVPVSDCPSVTCQRWRQEVANLLGQGYDDEAIFKRFSTLYGSEISGLPIEDNERNLALGIPALLAATFAIVVVWRVWRLNARTETRAHQAARTAGIRSDYERPVPDNVDPDYLERFLKMVEDKA